METKLIFTLIGIGIYIGIYNYCIKKYKKLKQNPYNWLISKPIVEKTEMSFKLTKISDNPLEWLFSTIIVFGLMLYSLYLLYFQ